jgi:nitrogen fixation NifU-like protein
LLNNFTHQSKHKNPICGDVMEISLLVKKNKIKDFGYQCKSCIYCQASVSLLSRKLINKSINTIKELLHFVETFFEKDRSVFPKKWSVFNKLFCKKQYDYGGGNINLGGDLEDDDDRMFALTALVIRMNDKVNRLKNIIVKHRGNNAVADETYLDAFRDLSIYGIIAQLVSEKEWGR